jgi:hypothetical protein
VLNFHCARLVCCYSVRRRGSDDLRHVGSGDGCSDEILGE